MSPKKPRPGEVWSLVPHGSLASQPSPLFLIESGEGERWLCLPLFGNGRIFTDRDIEISDDPEFLLGERWCAARDEFEIHERSLWQVVERLPDGVLQQVRQFRRGFRVALLSGTPLVPGLGDPRSEPRERWLSEMREWARLPVTAKIRIWLGEKMELLAGADSGVEFDSHPSGVLGRIAAAAGAAGIGAAAGGLGSLIQGAVVGAVARGAGREPTCRFDTRVGGYDVGVLAGYAGGRWRIALAVDADSVVFESSDGDQHMERIGSAWTLGGAPAMPDGRFRFRLDGSGGTEVLELALGELEESDGSAGEDA